MNRSLRLISLIFLLLFLSFQTLIGPLRATEIFSSSYELGNFSDWTGTTGAPAVVSSTSHHGTYSMETDSSGEYSYKNFSGEPTLYTRDLIKLSALPPSNFDCIETVKIRGATGTICYLRFFKHDDIMKLRLYWEYPSASNAWITFDYQTDTFYSVKLRFTKGGSGGYQVWVNGVSKYSTVKDTSGAPDAVQVQFGQLYSNYAVTTNHDCAVISDQDIDEEQATDKYYFNYDFWDLDNQSMNSLVTRKLYNDTQLLDYTEGQSTLDNGTYTLKVYRHGVEVNQTVLPTITYGNQTVNVTLSSKPHQSGGMESPFNTSYSVNADNGTAIGIQAAVDNVTAAGGGIVYIPAGTFNMSESAPWNPVEIPSGVSVHGEPTERFANGTVKEWLTVLQMPWDPPDESYFFELQAGTKRTRISDIKFVGYREFDNQDTSLHRGVACSNGEFRVDHCYFRHCTGTAITVWGMTARGLIDRNRFLNVYGFGHPWETHTIEYGINHGPGYYPADWEEDIDDLLGKYTNHTVFIEDNYFERWRHDVAANSGSHYVFRYNVVRRDRAGHNVDAHGAGGNGPGTRCIEVYYNNFTLPVSQGSWNSSNPSTVTDYIVQFRGGGGVVFNNYVRDYTDTLVYGTDESSNETYHPTDIWVWDNDLDTENGMWPVRGSDITEGVDYYLYAKSGYGPYTYPHPLTGSQGQLTFNKTVANLVINAQTENNLTFSGDCATPIRILVDAPRNATYGYVKKNGVEQTYGDIWIYNETGKYFDINASSLSTLQIYFPSSGSSNIWQLTFPRKDRDNNVLSESTTTWQLLNGTQLLSYSQGQYSLLDGTYILKTYYKGHLVDETSLPTATYGNSSVQIPLQMKQQEWGYIAANDTLSTLTILEQSDLILQYNAAGTGVFTQIIDVLEKPEHVKKDGIVQEEGVVWTYSNKLVVIQGTLSLWEHGFSSPIDPSNQEVINQIKNIMYRGITLLAMSIVVIAAVMVLIAFQGGQIETAGVVQMIFVIFCVFIAILMMAVFETV